MSPTTAHHQAQARLLAVTAAAADALICADASGRISFWSGGAPTLFGWSEGEALGRPLTDLMPERYRPAHRAGFARAMQGAGVGHGSSRRVVELEALHRNGHEIPIELSLSSGEHGGERFFVGVVRDISDRRARDLALHAVEDELRRSNAELQQFAYTASHDLNEPLRIVDGYLELLRRRYADTLDADAGEFIGYAVEAVGRMRALIDALLHYARAGAGSVAHASVDVNALAFEAREAVSMAIEERGVEVEIGPLPAVAAEPALLRQVFQNLLANAVRHADPAAPRVRVTATNRDGLAEFSVADNGPGVPADERERVFEMFTRGSTGETPDRGAGIGLAICKRVVERHGGWIRLQEAPGGGADVRFTIPLAPGAVSS